MTLLFHPLGAVSTLLADYGAEVLFWALVAMGALWFLWFCWRIIQKNKS